MTGIGASWAAKWTRLLGSVTKVSRPRPRVAMAMRSGAAPGGGRRPGRARWPSAPTGGRVSAVKPDVAHPRAKDVPGLIGLARRLLAAYRHNFRDHRRERL